MVAEEWGSRILDFGFWILDFGFWILDFGFWILDFKVKREFQSAKNAMNHFFINNILSHF
jgi:hypothetical protein